MTLFFSNEPKRLIATTKDRVVSIVADCVVRNEINGWRRLHAPKEVVRAMTHDPYNKPPVMPRTFPKGHWTIYAPRKRTDEYLAPYFIPTNAEQYLDVWDLDENGGYDKATGNKVLDIGYGLHFSTSNTTVGCIKIHNRDNLLWLVKQIDAAISCGESVTMKV